MTTHQYKRCQHCGDEYLFQGSGHGCNAPLNDHNWCSGCKQAVLKSLAETPRRFECRYRPIQEIPDRFQDVTLEKLLEWEQENQRSAHSLHTQGHLIPRRVFTPLINLETGESQNVREVRSPSGQRFILSTWESREYEVTVPWEWDLQAKGWTNRPWR